MAAKFKSRKAVVGLLNVYEAASFLSVGYQTIKRLTSSGVLTPLYPTQNRRCPRYEPTDLLRAAKLGRWHAMRTPVMPLPWKRKGGRK